MMRKSVAAGVAFAAGLACLAAAPTAGQAAVTAYPVVKFVVDEGVAYTRGTVTFYDRSARVSGTFNGLSSFTECTSVTAQTLNASGQQLTIRETDRNCGGSQHVSDFGLDVPANIPGGAAIVRVAIWNHPEGSDSYPMKSLKVSRCLGPPAGC